MEKRNRGISARRRKSRLSFAAAGATGGFAATVLFALCHGGIGIWYASLWHGSICLYYSLLSLLRGILLAAERRAGGKERKIAEDCRRRILSMTSGFVLALNAVLITPVSLMVLDQRPVHTGLIPAIASAAYTTYKMTAAAVKLRRTSRSILDRELSRIRLVDALVSVLVLQNTMIIAVEGRISRNMFCLAAVSSAGIFLLILVMSIVWFVQSRSQR